MSANQLPIVDSGVGVEDGGRAAGDAAALVVAGAVLGAGDDADLLEGLAGRALAGDEQGRLRAVACSISSVRVRSAVRWSCRSMAHGSPAAAAIWASVGDVPMPSTATRVSTSIGPEHLLLLDGARDRGDGRVRAGQPADLAAREQVVLLGQGIEQVLEQLAFLPEDCGQVTEQLSRAGGTGNRVQVAVSRRGHVLLHRPAAGKP